MFGRAFVAILTGMLLTATVSAQDSATTPPAIQTQQNEDPTRVQRIAPGSPEEWARACEPWDDWEKFAPPYLLSPGVFYVGTCGITSLLVRTREGYALIDVGTRKAAPAVLANFSAFSIPPEDVKVILTSHEHFDHVGGVAWMQRQTGAAVVALPVAASTLSSGKADPDDPQAGMHDDMMPVPFVVSTTDGAPIRLGDVTFTPVATPGHTPGATSWQWEICRFKTCTSFVYADSLSPVSRDGYRFSDHPEYVAEYRAGLERLAALDCDILLTPHPSASDMLKRAATGTFEGGLSCQDYATRVSQRLDARLSEEANIE